MQTYKQGEAEMNLKSILLHKEYNDNKKRVMMDSKVVDLNTPGADQFQI